LKQIILAALLALSCTHTHAQLFSGDPNQAKDTTFPKGEFGVKLGADMRGISGNVWKNNYNAGITGGFWARMHKNKAGVRAEVLVSTTKYEAATHTDSFGTNPTIVDSAGNVGNFRAINLDVPVLFEYNITRKLLLHVGLQYTSLLALNNLTALKGSYQNLFNKSEFSGVIGLELLLPSNFSAGARFRYGFSNLNNSEVSGFSGSWKTMGFQLYACYKIK
jgi:Outer membrane protein beta-barrel domain